MESMLRVLLSIVVVGGAMAGLFQLDPDELKEFGQNVAKLPSNCLEHERQLDRRKALDSKQQWVQQSTERKHTLAGEVLAGRTTLRRAASQFGELSKGAPYPWDHYLESHPEWSLEVRCAQYVIDEVKDILGPEVGNATEIISRLEAEKDAW
jgi:hypothetical protein